MIHRFAQRVALLLLAVWGSGALGQPALRPKPFARDTVLSRDGRPEAVVVAPSTPPEWAAFARRLAVAANAEVVDEADALDRASALRQDLRAKHLVLLGKATNNRAIFRLYARELAACDDRYPGRGGWVVRTICDLHGTGKNAIVVGCSDLEAAPPATDAFCAMLVRRGRDVVLPWAMKIHSGVDEKTGARLYPPRTYTEAEWRKYRKEVTYAGQPIQFFPSRVLLAAERAADRHFRTGSTGDLRMFWPAVAELERMGERMGDMRGMEFRLKGFVTAWERLEASPTVSDADRDRMVCFLHSLGLLFEGSYWHGNGAKRAASLRVTTNHVSNGTLGYLRLGRYLLRRCALAPEAEKRARAWVADADALFRGQAQSHKSGCDANGYQWWTMKHMMIYALRRPDGTYFWNGSVRHTGNLIFVTADSMGHAAGFGDVGGRLTGYSAPARYLLGYGAAVYRDGRMLWIARHCGGRGGPPLAGRLDAAEPVDLLGVAVAPWSRTIYDDLARRDESYRSVPWHSTFDKISFRDRAEPDQPYLLLDGIGGMGHGQDDCNAITRVTAHGKIWLIDCEYDKKTMYDHSGVFVARDGVSEGAAYAAQLEALADFPTVGVTRTSVPNANGLKWARNIVWVKAGYFIVVDELLCHTPGNYMANCIWRCRTYGELDGQVWRSRQGDSAFAIVSDGAARAKTAEEGRDHFRGVKAFVLRQVRSGPMAPGDRSAYANLLLPRRDRRSEPEPTLDRVSPAAVRITWPDHADCVCVGPSDVEGMDTDGLVTFTSPDAVSLVRATRCRVAGVDLLEASLPVSLELHRVGAGVLLASADTTVALPALDGQGPRRFARGRHVLTFLPSAGLNQALARWQAVLRERPRQDVAQSGRPSLPAPGGRERWAFDDIRHLAAIVPVNVTSSLPSYGKWGPVARLIDQGWRSSAESVMWTKAAEPEVTIELGEVAELRKVLVRTWEPLGAGYALARVELSVSREDDGSAFTTLCEDVPLVGTDRVGSKNVNGLRAVSDLACRSRYVRLRFHPRGPESRAYVAEVVVYGPGRPGRVMDLAACDLDGDGAQEVLIAGSDAAVRCLNSAGQAQWSFKTGGPVNAVWAGRLDGQAAVLVGSEDAHVYRLDPSGREVWRCRTYARQGATGQNGGVRCLAVDQSSPGARQRILVGADNWYLSLLTPDGKEARHTYYYAHETTFIRTGDVTGDGRRDIFTGTSFADGNWFDAEATQSTFLRTRLGPAASGALVDLDGDGSAEMVLAGQNGLAAADRAGKILWRLDTRCPQTCVEAVDLDSDGRPEIVTGGKNGFLTALSREGKVLWTRNLGDSVNDLVAGARVMGRPGLWVACDDGAAHAWSTDGACLGRFGAGAQALRVLPTDLDGDGKQELLVTSSDGRLRALEP